MTTKELDSLLPPLFKRFLSNKAHYNAFLVNTCKYLKTASKEAEENFLHSIDRHPKEIISWAFSWDETPQLSGFWLDKSIDWENFYDEFSYQKTNQLTNEL